MSSRGILRFGLLSCLLLAAGGFVTGCSAQVEPLSVAARLQQSMRALERAQSHEEWETSPFHPIQVFQSFQETAGVDSISPLELCTQLRQLPDPDLAVFAEAISGRGNRLDLECRTELSERLGAYAARLEDKMSRLLRNGHRNQLKGRGRAESTFLPQPRFVDSVRETTISHGDLEEGEFALTFDDGPHRSLTPRLLQMLAESNVLASFFVVGQSAQVLPEIVRDTFARGHSMGTHSWTHAKLPSLSFEAAVREIDSTQKFLSQLLGENNLFFRFPYGSHSAKLIGYLSSRHWTSFLWNVDTLDWKIRDPEQLLKKVMVDLQYVRRGVVLFHDIQPQTIAIMPNLLYEMSLKGYRIRVLWPSKQPFPRLPGPVLP